MDVPKSSEALVKEELEKCVEAAAEAMFKADGGTWVGPPYQHGGTAEWWVKHCRAVLLSPAVVSAFARLVEGLEAKDAWIAQLTTALQGANARYDAIAAERAALLRRVEELEAVLTIHGILKP